jgi:hypothetical protein
VRRLIVGCDGASLIAYIRVLRSHALSLKGLAVRAIGSRVSTYNALIGRWRGKVFQNANRAFIWSEDDHIPLVVEEVMHLGNDALDVAD